MDSDGVVHVVHDWINACVRREPFSLGAIAAVYTNDCPDQPRTDATVEQTGELLDAYQHQTGRVFIPSDLEVLWAAGLWVLACNAAGDHFDGVPAELEFLDPTGQLIQRARNAGDPASVIAELTGA